MMARGLSSFDRREGIERIHWEGKNTTQVLLTGYGRFLTFVNGFRSNKIRSLSTTGRNRFNINDERYCVEQTIPSFGAVAPRSQEGHYGHRWREPMKAICWFVLLIVTAAAVAQDTVWQRFQAGGTPAQPRSPN